MRDNIKKLTAIAAIVLLAGCAGTGQEFTGDGILLKNELSSEVMQPGGSVILRTSVNNFFDNELIDVKAKLTRNFGQLNVDGGVLEKEIGEVQANPNATARTNWILNVRESALSGTEFTNKIRLCFKYNQTAWHEVALVNSFDIESVINSGSETGPLKITFSGLDMPYIYNDRIQSKVPISVSIKNNYIGYVGNLDLAKDEIPNITYVEMRIYDMHNTSPESLPEEITSTKPKHFEVIEQFTNPSCSEGQTAGCFNCSNELWDMNESYIKCYAHNLSVFGDETFLGNKLNITGLETEELIQIIEIMASYDYCIESEDFTLTVFTPGGS